MDYHHKYQKKGQYLLHPGIIEYKRNSWFFQIKFNVFLLLVLALMRIVPVAMMSFDIVMAFLLLSFWLIGRPIMLKGKMPFNTYYKRDYQNDVFLLFSKIILFGSIVRTAVVTVYYLFYLWVVSGDHFETNHAIFQIKQILFNPVPQLIAVMVFLFFFYYMFLKEKYISIKDFTEEVMGIVYRKRYTINQAVRDFIYKRDSELEKELLKGVKYGHNEVSSTEMVKDNGQKQTPKQVRKKNEEATSSTTSTAPQVPLRRQSRR